jgi:hypothetical protein
MRTIVFIFALAAFGLAHASDNAASPQGAHFTNRLARILTYATPRQDWITNYFGKTLSSLGRIQVIRIGDNGNQSWVHRDLWQLIEESEVQDYAKGSHFVGVPPSFTIDYVGGLSVQADRYNVLITLPDGRKCSAQLRPPSKRQ